MKNDLQKIDKLFHNALDHSAEQPPAYVWKDIERTLDDIQAITNKQKQSNKRYLLLACLFLATITSIVLIWSQQSFSDAPVSAVSVIPEKMIAPATNDIPVAGNNLSAGMVHQPLANGSATDGRLLQQTEQTVEATENTIPAISAPDENLMLHDKLPIAETISVEPTNLTALAPMSVQQAPESVPMEAAFISHSVKNTVATHRPSRLSLSLFFAPDITTRNLAQDRGSSEDEKKEELSRTERNSAFDYTIGARIEYALNKHFSVQSGISFSSNTIDISPKTIFARYDVDGTVKYRFNLSTGYTFFKPKKAMAAPLAAGDSTQALASSSLLHYVNIPLALKYNYPIGKRFNLFAQAGITARFITKQSIAAVYAIGGDNEKNTSNEITGLKTSYFNGVVGFGADYSLTSRLAITVFPSFNFATTSININAPVKAYPNTLSFAGGLKIRF